MRLRHHWASGGVVEYDPTSGNVTARHSEIIEPVGWGSVWKQRGRWFGIWHDGDSLIFQCSQNRWKLTTEVTFRVIGRYWRTFQITRNGNVEFQFSYWFRGAFAANFDPTYDRLEEEADDFFLYVVGMWEYWQNRSTDEFAALAPGGDSGNS